MTVFATNPRITPKDRNAIKGNLRRAFARSELHNRILDAAVIQGHFDPLRPRVKTWCRCNVCKIPEARSYMVVDHIIPVIPLDKTFADMSVDETIDRLWCEESNLQAICEKCHDVKTAAEKKLRPKPVRKPRKKPRPKPVRKKACATF